jgi:hypothetical protein
MLKPKMKEWQLQLATRWEILRVKGAVLGWHGDDSPFLHALAAKAGMKWYETRSADKVHEFIRCDAHGLLNNLPGFGRLKCQHLIEILEAASNEVEVVGGTLGASAQAFTRPCVEVLQCWGIPMEYPLHLLPLSTRLMNFCQNQQITTLPILLNVWASIGRAGLLSHENIGRRTVDELEDLANAIAHADAASARRWLPINDAENGLCLRRALALNHEARSPRQAQIVARRLVDSLKLEEVGVEFQMTRERVRQLEAAYLRDVCHILDWFTAECALMLEAWMEGKTWQSQVLPQSPPEAEMLILAAIEACFEATPQGVARRLSSETEMQTWLEAAMNHPDLHLGGFDLQEFLDSHVQNNRHEEFINQLGSRPAIVIDYANGLVKPAYASVRDTIVAILAQEDEPIPLTWLVRRVQSVEGCEEGDADFILRNRYRWSQLGFMNLSKILWDQ